MGRGNTLTMIYKKRAFTLVELMVAILLSAIIVFFSYTMTISAYKMFTKMNNTSYTVDNMKFFEAKVNKKGEVEGLSDGKAYILVSQNYNGNTQGKVCSIEVLKENEEEERKKDGPPSCSLKVYSNGKIIATPVNATKYGFSETYKNGNEIEYQFKSEKVVGVT